MQAFICQQITRTVTPWDVPVSESGTWEMIVISNSCSLNYKDQHSVSFVNAETKDHRWLSTSCFEKQWVGPANLTAIKYVYLETMLRLKYCSKNVILKDS